MSEMDEKKKKKKQKKRESEQGRQRSLDLFLISALPVNILSLEQASKFHHRSRLSDTAKVVSVTHSISELSQLLRLQH